MQYDTKGIEEKKTDFPIIPPTPNMVGEITKIEDRNPVNKLPYISMEITVTAGDFSKRKLWDNIYVIGHDEEKTNNALGMFRTKQSDLGMSKEEIDANTNTEYFRSKVQGLKVQFDCYVATFPAGNQSNRIKNIKKLEASNVPF